MPPRRPPRRGKKHSLPGAPALAEIALKDVRRAYSLVERGDHANAAQLFERQARDAADRGIFMPAAHLYLQAGRARLLAGETEAAQELLYQGLGILADHLDVQRLTMSANQLIDDLLRMGQDTLAGDVHTWLKHALKTDLVAVDDGAKDTPARGRRPTQCPRCNAILRNADIVPWNSVRGICVYCGSLIDVEEIA
jgi:hypothetical protein